MANVFVAADSGSSLFEGSQGAGNGSFFLPLGSTVNTSNTSSVLAETPLLEAFLVEVLAASSLAPNQVLSGLHSKDTDRTLAIGRLALSVVARAIGLIMAVFKNWGSCDGCVGKDGFNFFRKEGILVAQVSWGFENDDQGIINMLTLLTTHQSIHACTSWVPTNSDLIDIALTTSNIKMLINITILVTTLLSVQHEHTLIANLLQFGLIRIIWLRNKSSQSFFPSLWVSVLMSGSNSISK